MRSPIQILTHYDFVPSLDLATLAPIECGTAEAWKVLGELFTNSKGIHSKATPFVQIYTSASTRGPYLGGYNHFRHVASADLEGGRTVEINVCDDNSTLICEASPAQRLKRIRIVPWTFDTPENFEDNLDAVFEDARKVIEAFESAPPPLAMKRDQISDCLAGEFAYPWFSTPDMSGQQDLALKHLTLDISTAVKTHLNLDVLPNVGVLTRAVTPAGAITPAFVKILSSDKRELSHIEQAIAQALNRDGEILPLEDIIFHEGHEPLSISLPWKIPEDPRSAHGKIAGVARILNILDTLPREA